MSISGDARASVVALFAAYGASVGVPLQVYRARPRSVNAPTAFVEGVGIALDWTLQLHIDLRTVEAYVLFRNESAGDGADQKDTFVDGFIDYCATRYHEAGANTTIGVVSVEDVPDFVPTWLPPEKQVTYYAARIMLEVRSQG